MNKMVEYESGNGFQWFPNFRYRHKTKNPRKSGAFCFCVEENYLEALAGAEAFLEVFSAFLAGVFFSVLAFLASCFTTGEAKETPAKSTVAARIALNFFMMIFVLKFVRLLSGSKTTGGT
jgi:hypothetical protein